MHGKSGIHDVRQNQGVNITTFKATNKTGQIKITYHNNKLYFQQNGARH